MAALTERRGQHGDRTGRDQREGQDLDGTQRDRGRAAAASDPWQSFVDENIAYIEMAVEAFRALLDGQLTTDAHPNRSA